MCRRAARTENPYPTNNMTGFEAEDVAEIYKERDRREAASAGAASNQGAAPLVGTGEFVRLLVGLIYWSGITIMALVVGLALVTVVWLLAQPGQIEAALCALGACVIIVALIAVWVWAKMKRSEPNVKDEPRRL